MQNTYKQGSWNIICQRCGFKKKAEEVKKEWTGLMVCHPCFEHRHPQDFLRGRQEKIGVPYSVPESTDTFVTVTYVDSTVGTQDNTIPPGTFE